MASTPGRHLTPGSPVCDLCRPRSEGSHPAKRAVALRPGRSGCDRGGRGVRAGTAWPSCPRAGSPEDSTCQTRSPGKPFGSLVQSVGQTQDRRRWPTSSWAPGTHMLPLPSPVEAFCSPFSPGGTHSTTDSPSSSDGVVSSSDWSLSRSQGSRVELSATSSTGAMLGRRLPEPFSVGSASLLPPLPPPLCAGWHSVFWRSMATVPGTERLNLAGSPSPVCPGDRGSRSGGGQRLPVTLDAGRSHPGAGQMCKLRPERRDLPRVTLRA